MSTRQKRTEKNTVITVVILVAILIIGSIALKGLLSPKDNNDNKTPVTDGNDNNTSGSLKDGTYTAKSPEPSNGYTGVVTMEVSNGNITSLVYDSLDEQGESKRQLSSTGKYVMTEDGPTWEEQANLLAEHVIANQNTDKLVIDEGGKTDAVSGVSIDITEFISLTKETLEEASSDQTN